MAKIILVMGLPGSGKTTLANKLAKKLDADHFEADRVRTEFDDWDFSEEGRTRQATRMRDLAATSKRQWAVCDFVCPKQAYRDLLNADIIVWMDTIQKGRYEDTNNLFEKPEKTNYHYQTFQSDHQAQSIAADLMPFDWKKPTVQMLGRWQPWHDGHMALFERSLSKTGQVAIQVRDVSGSSGGEGQDDNPFIFEDVRTNIINALAKAGYSYAKEYIIMQVPNIVNITYGRGVGYAIEEESFESAVTDISATKIRAQMRQNGLLN